MEIFLPNKSRPKAQNLFLGAMFKLVRNTLDIRWVTIGMEVSVKGPCFRDNVTLVQMVTVTLGSKWMANERSLRKLKHDVDMDHVQSLLEEV